MSNNLNILQVSASQAQKEVAINDGNAQIDAALTEWVSIDLTAGNATLTTLIEQSGLVMKCIGHTVARDLNLAPLRRELVIWNAGTGIVSVKCGTTTITVAVGLTSRIYLDGTTNGMVLTDNGSAGGGATTFTGLSDVPSSYSGSGLKALRVNTGATGLEFYTPTAPTTYTAGTGLGLTGSQFNITDAELVALINLTGAAADQMFYFTSATAMAVATLTAFARTILDDVDAPSVRTTIGAQASLLAFNSQTGTTYTLVLGDAAKRVEMNNAASNTLTVPPNSSVALPVGTQIEVTQMGAGQTAIAAGAGVTIRSASGNLKITGQYSGAVLSKRATDEWVLIGSLVP